MGGCEAAVVFAAEEGVSGGELEATGFAGEDYYAVGFAHEDEV